MGESHLSGGFKKKTKRKNIKRKNKKITKRKNIKRKNKKITKSKTSK